MLKPCPNCKGGKQYLDGVRWVCINCGCDKTKLPGYLYNPTGKIKMTPQRNIEQRGKNYFVQNVEGVKELPPKPLYSGVIKLGPKDRFDNFTHGAPLENSTEIEL